MVALNDANEVYDDDYDDQDLFHPSTRTRTLLTVTPRSTSPAPGHYPNLRLLSHSINTGTLTESRTFRLAGCVFGILGVFLVYGLLQEKLMTRDYEGQRFQDTALLVTINRLVSIAVALIIIHFRCEPPSPIAPPRAYLLVSATNFLATYCQYEALKYVTFPTQTLGKCAKMLPVLVIGAVWRGKQYAWREYAAALLVMFGCSLFLTTGEVSSSKHGAAAAYDTPLGLLLIVCYLGFDGLTSTAQEALFRDHTSMSTHNQMLYVNASSAVLGVVGRKHGVSSGSLVFPWHAFDVSASSSSRLLPALQFAINHPQLLSDALLLSLCSSLGQLIIYQTIKEFGALLYSTVMTTRQFVGILLSALVFGHALSGAQWIGAVLVFMALYWRTAGKSRGTMRSVHGDTMGSPSSSKSSLLPVYQPPMVQLR